jgi:hypothetical protein
MRLIAWPALALAALLLSGCTLIASRVAITPPGVNKYSFRECLLARSFYSPPALTGIALRDWYYRHGQPGFVRKGPEKEPTRYDILEQKDGAFVATAAGLIAEGMMPSVEFWDPRVTDPQTPDSAVSAANAYYDDKGLNTPYVDAPAPQQYDYSADPAASGAIGPQKRPSPGFAGARDWRLNRFLDCYIAPVGGPAATIPSTPHDLSPLIAAEKGDEDIEGRLLRGHILLALLTQYGTELIVSHPSRRQVAQAELLLGHVKDAETSLRGASLIMSEDSRAKALKGASALLPATTPLIAATDKDGKALLFQDGKSYATGADGTIAHDAQGKPVPADIASVRIADIRGKAQLTLGWFDYTTRLLRVFQVGVDIQRIDAEQSLDRASNLIAAFSSSVGSFLPILKDGLAGAVTVQKVKLYGNAYLRDARETLALSRTATTPNPDGSWTYQNPTMIGGWRLWDAELARACQVLATVAKKDPASAVCIPPGKASESGS